MNSPQDSFSLLDISPENHNRVDASRGGDTENTDCENLEFQHAQAALAWDELFQHLCGFCLTPYGIQDWQQTPFLSSAKAAQSQMDAVDALKQMLMRFGDVAFDVAVPDIASISRRLEKNGVLTLSDAGQLLKALVIGLRYFKHFFAVYQKSDARHPALDFLTAMPLDELQEATAMLKQVLVYDSQFVSIEMRPDASLVLQQIKRAIKSQEDRIQAEMESLLKRPELAEAFQSRTITERNGRRVFPIKTAFKSKLPGAVLGSSASGATVFVEPQVLQAENNRLQALVADCQKEISRILRQLSADLHPYWHKLDRFCRILGQLDRQLAAARLSKRMRGNPVTVLPAAHAISLSGARHPLLLLQKLTSVCSEIIASPEINARAKNTVSPDMKTSRGKEITPWDVVVPNTIQLGVVASQSSLPDPDSEPDQNTGPVSEPNSGPRDSDPCDSDDGFNSGFDFELDQNKLDKNQKTSERHYLPSDIRTMVITGPNTGGKTVLLKTVGLFALMVRAGLHLPVDENGAMGFFDPVLVDIGDQQSISQNLSTFSAHMKQFIQFLKPGRDLSQSLIVVDEIAAGTDPEEGAAIARAILEALYNRGAMTFISTHLSQLKLDAQKHPGYMNASMAFDATTLLPTYQLMYGIPGASNGIIIAEKLGLSADIVDAARASLKAPERDSSDLLQELAEKNKKADEALAMAKSYELSTKHAYEAIAEEKQKTEAEKRKSLQLYQSGLQAEIQALQKQLKRLRKDLLQDVTLTDLNEQEALLKTLSGKAETILSGAESRIEKTNRLTIDRLTLGQAVFSVQLNLSATVEAINTAAETVVIRAGILKVTVPLRDLQPAKNTKNNAKGIKAGKTRKKPAKRLVSRYQRPLQNTSETLPLENTENTLRTMNPQFECDIRGLRVDAGLDKVQQFLDQAIQENQPYAAIIHGVGTGALKKAVQQALKQSKLVKQFCFAQAVSGGDGKTIVELM
ncbi:MAG: Smr/MutS family protein [Cyanobacteria bacterium P01_H01_bin.74]